jgi:hypothetical protein
VGKKKIGSTIFVGLLLVLLAFVVGVRYGTSVQEVNTRTEILEKVLSTISPLITPTTLPTKAPLTFKNHVHAECKVEFLYPAELTSEEVQFVCPQLQLPATLSAELKDRGYVSSRVGSKIIWFTAPPNLINLVLRTLTSTTP